MIVWVEPGCVQAGGEGRPLAGPLDLETLSASLASLPAGGTQWIIDDLWAPSLLLSDCLELPKAAEAREGFMRWRYAQHLGVEEPQFVQSWHVGEASWLLVGMPQTVREGWLQASMKVGRPIRSLIPRWLWIYNRLAPSQDVPGMLLSLASTEAGLFSGTLAAWGDALAILRQWSEPAPAEVWLEERVHPTAAYLQRDGRTPRELLVWGAREWPGGALPWRLLPCAIPQREER